MSNRNSTSQLSFFDYISILTIVILFFGLIVALGKLFSGDYHGVFDMWIFFTITITVFIISRLLSTFKVADYSSKSDQYNYELDHEYTTDWINNLDPITGDITPPNH